jgi:8'-apo-carotenoid 13,14-cleaving dioxygenase
MKTSSPYVTGNFAPVSQEVVAMNLPVIGQIPPELNGLFARNGANPLPAADPGLSDQLAHEFVHEFAGEGMVHGVYLQDGQAQWYRNRWVRGDSVRYVLNEPDLEGRIHANDFAANTHVIGFAGKLWALVEGGTTPLELDRNLNTLRRNNFFGTLPHGFSAHPKLDPKTGELHALCYTWDSLEALEYVVVGQDGRVKQTKSIALPGMGMVHDMGLTQRYVVVLDLPVLLEPLMAEAGHPIPFRWQADYPARVGLMPRSYGAQTANATEMPANIPVEMPANIPAEIQWFDINPCYVYHPVNAYDTPEGQVIMDVCRYERMFDQDCHGSLGDALPTLDRWIIDPATAQVTEQRLDDRYQDYPQINPQYLSLPYRYAYLALFGEGINYGGTIKQDLQTGTAVIHDYGPGCAASEPIFVPRASAVAQTREDDGWVLTFVYNEQDQSSALVILDALDFAAPPIAQIQLPQRVPFGFHGSWIPAADLPG